MVRRLACTSLVVAALSGCGGSSNSPDPATTPVGPAPLAAPTAVSLSLLSRYSTGIFNAGAQEIVAYESVSRRMFSINSAAGRVDVVNLVNPATPARTAQLNAEADAARVLGRAMKGINSVAASQGIVAVAVQGDGVMARGAVALYRASDLVLLTAVDAGVLPDAVAISADARFIVVANEAEPSDDYTQDPEGSITVLTLGANPSQPVVTQLDFRAFNAGGARTDELPAGVRIFGGRAGAPSSVAQDLEPEYVAISGGRAYVTLQENGAIATVTLDGAAPRIERIAALGTKDHSLEANRYDASDRDNGRLLKAWPVRGMYLPDAIAVVDNGSDALLYVANEGDQREYAGFNETARVSTLTLDPTTFPNATDLKKPESLGRLNVSKAGSDIDGDGDVDRLLSFGTRSFAIFRTTGERVFDSGADFERITNETLGANFNSTNSANESGDSRSDDKGPEPEAITVGTVEGGRFAFIGLERVGGIFVYNITNPLAPQYVSYRNDRNFAVPVTIPDGNGDGQPDTNPAVGDLGPESVVFVAAADSPDGRALLLVGNEISGTTTIYEVRAVR